MTNQPSTVNTGGGNYFAGPVEAETIVGTQILYPPDEGQLRDHRDKLVLLQRVAEAWVTGANSPLAKTRSVNRQFIDQERLLLPRRFRPNLSRTPVASSLGGFSAETTPTSIPNSEPTWSLFQQSVGSLLILSQPGGGKTISLLEIAEIALLEFEKSQKPTIRAPVILPLRNWRTSFNSLSAWIVDEIKRQFKIPATTTTRWLQNNDLILLFDGLDALDEPDRNLCVQQLNQFIDNHGTAPMALSCRTDVYERLEEKVAIDTAIELMPLEQPQVDAYFAASGTHLQGLHAAVKQDRDLYTLLNSPLMLQLFSIAYQDAQHVILPTASLEEQRLALLGQFVSRNLSQQMRWSPKQMMGWLGWLGDRLQQNEKSIFYIEEIQPSWLASAGKKRSYIFISRIVSVLLASIIGGFLIGLGLYFFQEAYADIPGFRNDGLIRGFIEGPLGGLASGPMIALIEWLWQSRLKHAKPIKNQSIYVQSGLKIVLFLIGCMVATAATFALVLGGLSLLGFSASAWFAEGLLVGLNFGIGAGLVFGIGERSLATDIKTSEALNWDWRSAMYWGGLSALFGLAIGFFVSWIAQGTAIYQLIAARFAAPALPLAIVAMLIFGLIGFVFSGLKGTVVHKQRLTPNYGLRQSLFNSLLLAPAIGIAFGILGLLLGYFLIGWRPPVTLTTVPYGLFIGLLAAAWFGGLFLVQHVSLRLMLQRDGFIPPLGEFADMLNLAADRYLLSRVGGGFQFFHSYLQVYFVEQLDDAESELS